MDKTKKIGLIPKLIAAIILGILIGKFMPEVVVKVFVTFSSIFGNFLGFLIPLIILGFIVSGIADLGGNAGKLLGITAGIAYLSTLISGFFAYIVGVNIFPSFIKATNMINDAVNPEEHLLKPFFTIEMDPIMTVMSALVFAFLLGLGISAVKGEGLKKIAFEFQQIVDKTISNVIIPLLPIYILSIFANMTYAGEVGRIISVFWKVFLIVIAMHLLIILIQFTIAGAVSKKNVFSMIKNQVPGYLTAIGTQSSAATIPVNLKCAESNGVSKEIREFVVPLCATIHLSGSTITLTSCAIAVMMLNNISFTLPQMLGFIAMLGVTMVAAPGVPGGAVMAALGVLQTNLHFTEAQLALMIALYITQDSFGTACNISGDNAIAVIVDSIYNKKKKVAIS
ncbi:dicarboxylate/amino acid:cation symporter [Clostridium algidicarnis]|uniref:dicarboxylate/amino acid:cation symporter n=1 Tax=Clostridium algidicarnis TaxID=37659 RepID=UPI00162A1E73|nr:dicarboxylate/amino acid:cation symporter [Clostridium algidicarnis]MBB6696912.1 dicarboxylate/amino acid:cation symporter [Clostridium algidicarnis]MBU3193261.1 dicarboxylate/amino acid:cation symporter [Clostridium algidicarnis]MBU3204617.1 dicarboxylate/amino acid:cation symporter [Clostridium algidicarnis]MBU3206571.1 dicarboxylate/amino acid:cation symporter [Clostridium algidicarnis]MBU3212898.1 dicarboxylate/amino acid:cation symporter [Clostridium algidicarnis]